MSKQKRKIIAIVGPTASGKTGIGVKLAKEFNGEIISADSRQVYRGLDIGTGKEGEPCQEFSNFQFPISNQCSNDQLGNGKINGKMDKWVNEKLRPNHRCIDGVPQWMIDIVDPEEKMTLFDYLPLARAAVEDIFSRGKVPIIVGGTGLYIQGLAEGFGLEKSSKGNGNEASIVNGLGATAEKRITLNETGVVTITEKRYSREQLDQLTIEQLNNILQEIHLEKYETVDHKNRHRLIRAIELAQEGLVPVKIKPDFEVLQIGVDVPRAELHERIDRRVDERFREGMLEEVEGLIQSGVSTDWLIGLGLEYREITEFVLSRKYNVESIGQKIHTTKYILHSTDEFQAMSQRLKFKIHQFARRQMTWFRRFPEIQWLSKYEEMKRFAKIFLEH